MYPLDALERFEKKYGEYDQLLDNYVKAYAKIDDRYEAISYQAATEALKALNLLMKHNALVAKLVGWNMAVEQNKKWSIKQTC